MNETSANPWDALEAPTTRTPRSLETRESAERTRTWSQPSILPDIEPRDGWDHKWVRMENRGVADKTNHAKRLREGWEPVDMADYPELQSYSGDSQSGRAEIGGLVLCRMPSEMVRQRTEYYTGKARQQESSAEEHYMRDKGELVKKFSENSRRVVFGPSGR